MLAGFNNQTYLNFRIKKVKKSKNYENKCHFKCSTLIMRINIIFINNLKHIATTEKYAIKTYNFKFKIDYLLFKRFSQNILPSFFTNMRSSYLKYICIQIEFFCNFYHLIFFDFFSKFELLNFFL